MGAILEVEQAGGRQYGVIIVIVAVGYGYVWWKGWKIPDFMFATRRGLSDACKSVAKNLDDVFASLRASFTSDILSTIGSFLRIAVLWHCATRNELSSKLDESSHKYDEISASSSATKDEVTGVRGEVSKFTMDLQTVNKTIQTLDTPSTSKPAIEPQPIASSSRREWGWSGEMDHTGENYGGTVSLPLTLEPSSPSTSNEANGHTRNAISASGLKEYQEISGAVESNPSAKISNGDQVTEIVEKSPSPELPATPNNVKSAGLLSRTISATRYFKFM
ncbi:Paramyosin [Bienertia sinuspersici]